MKTLKEISEKLNDILSPKSAQNIDENTSADLNEIKKTLTALIEAVEDSDLIFKTKSEYFVYHDDLLSLGFRLKSKIKKGDETMWVFTLK